MDETKLPPGESKPMEIMEGGKHKPITVLLLDDIEENLLLRSAILRQKGYQCV
jgi:response regulator RpfG family c-di-GMP phosphodiesterase